MLRWTIRALAVVWMAFANLLAHGQDAPEVQDDSTTQIQKAIEQYAEAFNARQIDALVALWSDDGIYINRTTGEQVAGRKALRAEMEKLFAEENAPKIAFQTESIELVSPNVAVERGVAIVTDAEGAVVESTYRTVFVEQAGNWLIDRVSEDEPLIEPPSHYDQLKGLEWLIGEWVDDGDGISIETESQWTKNKNYISRTYRVSAGPEFQSSGLQIIGWDARKQIIRSWLFDSDGGFVLGEWHESDGRWTVSSTVTLADGGAGSFTSVFVPQDDGSYLWRKINRVLDGKILPNLDEVRVRRR